MSFIVETMPGDRRFQMGREEFLRPMIIGTNWNKIRIGVRLGLTGNSTFTLGSFGIGVCQGNSGYLADTTVDWFGGWTTQSGITGNTVTFNAGTPNYYQLTSGTTAVWKRNNTTTTNTTATPAIFLPTQPTAFRQQLFCDILKGSPSYTATLWAPNTAGLGQTDIGEASFLQSMENEGTPTSVVAGSGVAVTYSGSGLHDTISLIWTRCCPVIEISTIAVARYL